MTTEKHNAPGPNGGKVPSREASSGRFRQSMHRLFDQWKIEERFFWAFNAGYWLFYLLFLFAAHASTAGWKPRIMLWTSLISAIGFSAGLLLHLVYRRIRLEAVRLRTLLFWIIGSVVVAGNYWYGIDKLLDRLMQGPSDQVIPYTWSNYLTYTFYYEILLTGWSVLYLVARFWFVLAEQRRRAQEADSLARHSRIQMLRYQLNPHFLFNALNSARALVDENEQHARDMITELSEFLRYSLVTKNESDIPLSNEIEAVRHYFEVEKKRYEDKLKVDFAIDPLAEEYPVVPFLLHPLVENAVKYGMRTSPMPLSIRVSARVNADRLCIDVCNTGTWIEPKSGENERGTGTGLFNVRQRLQTLFPDRHRFTVDKNNGRVCIRIEVTNPLVPSSRQEVGP